MTEKDTRAPALVCLSDHGDTRASATPGVVLVTFVSVWMSLSCVQQQHDWERKETGSNAKLLSQQTNPSCGGHSCPILSVIV